MEKLLLLAVVPAIILIAERGARDSDPRRGLRRALYAMVLFHLLYTFGVLYVAPRLLS